MDLRGRAPTPPLTFGSRARRKLGAWMNRIVFGSVGRWLSRPGLAFRLEYRPDYDVFDKKITDYAELRRAWLAGNATNNGGDFTRFYLLYQNIKQLIKDEVLGDFIELGVYKGNSATMLAALGRANGRRTYLLDTFAGFDPRDFKDEDAGRPRAIYRHLAGQREAPGGRGRRDLCPGLLPRIG